MSSTQIVFTTDATLKKQALAKLKQEGSTLKSLLQYAMKAYVQEEFRLVLFQKIPCERHS